MHGTIAATLYTHAASINKPSCIDALTSLLGIVNVASSHSGGANVLFADGHVEFVAATIHLPVWRSLGTRSAGDLP